MLLVVPGPDEEPWPTLGREICDFIEDRAVYGPGSLQGQPYIIDPEFRGFLYRASEVYPAKVRKPLPGGKDHAIERHPWAGRRRFKRVGLSVRKGLAKTEKEALVCYTHIHPEGPGRCDGFDARGNPVAAPVRAPYVPMLAYSLDQVEELAYGALKYIIENGPDADMFDVSLERALRLDEYGRADGGAWPLAQSPDSRDGGRTTLNAFDEPHRLYLPRHLKAHEVMDANLPKRPLDDPWSLYVGTAGEPGQGSVAENLHLEAEMIRDGKIERPDLFYLYRTDDEPARDLTDKRERIKAIAEATGPAGEWGPGQFDDIASKWDRPGADTGYLERVWLNRWKKSNEQAFDPNRWKGLARPGTIPRGALVTAGFDGARRKDSTAIVITEVATGTQELWAIWERPPDWPTGEDAEPWEIDEREVDQAVDELFRVMDVFMMFCDPPYWVDMVGKWAGRYPGKVEEWWTERDRPMAKAIRAYREAMGSGAVGWSEHHRYAGDLTTHIGNAGRRDVPGLVDDDDEPLFVLQKIHQGRKFDGAMAAVLSWTAYLLALKKGAKPKRKQWAPRRLR